MLNYDKTIHVFSGGFCHHPIRAGIVEGCHLRTIQSDTLEIANENNKKNVFDQSKWELCLGLCTVQYLYIYIYIYIIYIYDKYIYIYDQQTRFP